jgi:hypothetical protein
MCNYLVKRFSALAILSIFLLTSHTNAQVSVIKYKSSCFVSDSLKKMEETGNIYINNSILLTNVNDSIWMIDLLKCKKVNSYSGNIVSTTNNINNIVYNTDSRYFNGTKYFQNGSVFYFFLRDNNQQWFVRFSAQLGFEKICKVEGVIEEFFEVGQDVIAVLQSTSGNFYNNGSEVPSAISSGLIKFTKTGYIKKQFPIYAYCKVNGGYANFPLGFRSLTQVGNSIYIVFRSRNAYYNPEWGCEINGTKYQFDGNEWRLAKINMNFYLEKLISFQGVVNDVKSRNDSLVVYGSTDNLKMLNLNTVARPNNNNFHFSLTLDTNLTKVGSYCIFNGNKGIGDRSYEMFRPVSDSIYYYTFSGSIFGDKVYTSAGDISCLIGNTSDFLNCEPRNFTLITSLDRIKATFTKVNQNFQIMGINHSDFFINNNRYNKGFGNYYFLLKNSFLYSLDSLNLVLNSNLPGSEHGLVSIYPNPSRNVMKVELIKPSLIYKPNYKIFSPDGRVFLQGGLSSVSNEISITTMAKGFYFIAIFDGFGNIVEQHKILKE